VRKENEKVSELSRIRRVYADRIKFGKGRKYSWHSSHAGYRHAVKFRIFSKALKYSFGNNISNLKVLDIGCGTGGFLRQLIEWGGSPLHLIGVDLIDTRLDMAKKMSPSDVGWHLGVLNSKKKFNLVSAHTVFSSILDNSARQALADEMWKKVCKGGWIMIFDFRYNNPANPDVRKVTFRELKKWWPDDNHFILIDMLAPPIARYIVGKNYFLAELLTMVLPFLRSHFVYMVQKK
jgi:SAM-dependent methyltransferase